MSEQMNVSELAQVLFASALQRSDDPSPELIRAILASTTNCDRENCVACVAQEAGDHPDEYASRMRWALGAVLAAFPDLKAVTV
jgi:hypothetical protein